MKFAHTKRKKSSFIYGKFYKKLAGCGKELTILKLEKRVAQKERDLALLTRI